MDRLSSTLLRRLQRVYLPPDESEAPEDGQDWVRVLETDLADRGWLLDKAVRDRLSRSDRVTRTQWADWLLAVADQSVGAHQVHVPLFRSFPEIPRDLDRLFVDRV